MNLYPSITGIRPWYLVLGTMILIHCSSKQQSSNEISSLEVQLKTTDENSSIQDVNSCHQKITQNRNLVILWFKDYPTGRSIIQEFNAKKTMANKIANQNPCKICRCKPECPFYKENEYSSMKFKNLEKYYQNQVENFMNNISPKKINGL